MDKLRVTILCDNEGREGLKAEHGFSMLFERAGASLLLDAGASGLFAQNAAALSRDLSRVSAVALSHNHYDHTGGLMEFMRQAGEKPHLYLSAHFFKQSGWRRADRPGTIMPTSGPLTAAGLCEAGVDFRYLEADVFAIPEFEGGYALCNIPRAVPFETPDEADVAYRSGEWATDDYRDELALAFETASGLVVATGCAHTGVCSIARCARARLGGEIAAVIGGTHLIAHDAARARETARLLKADGIPRLVACHCTGEDGFAALAEAGYERGYCGFEAEF